MPVRWPRPGLRRSSGCCCSAPTASIMSCTWLGAVRLGAMPVVVSDLYKRTACNTSSPTPPRALLFIDAEQVPKLDRGRRRPAAFAEDHRGARRRRRARAAHVRSRRCTTLQRRSWRRSTGRRLSPPPQRRHLHVLFRRHHRHRQGHHPSRPRLRAGARAPRRAVGIRAPTTWCSPPRRNISPTASGRAC